MVYIYDISYRMIFALAFQLLCEVSFIVRASLHLMYFYHSVATFAQLHWKKNSTGSFPLFIGRSQWVEWVAAKVRWHLILENQTPSPAFRLELHIIKAPYSDNAAKRDILGIPSVYIGLQSIADLKFDVVRNWRAHLQGWYGGKGVLRCKRCPFSYNSAVRSNRIE